MSWYLSAITNTLKFTLKRVETLEVSFSSLMDMRSR